MPTYIYIYRTLGSESRSSNTCDLNRAALAHTSCDMQRRWKYLRSIICCCGLPALLSSPPLRIDEITNDRTNPRNCSVRST